MVEGRERMKSMKKKQIDQDMKRREGNRKGRGKTRKKSESKGRKRGKNMLRRRT